MFLALLTLLFIALKLTHIIAWSWFWVLAPLWSGYWTARDERLEKPHWAKIRDREVEDENLRNC